MSVIHHQWSEGFKILPDAIPRDPRLSLRDIGLLWVLLEKPDSWEFSARGLEKILPNDGHASIGNGLRNLEKAGYLTRRRTRTDGKITGIEWVVSDLPRDGFQPEEKLPVENHPQYKNERNKRMKKTTQRQEKPLCQETEDEESGIHFFNGEEL